MRTCLALLAAGGMLALLELIRVLGWGRSLFLSYRRALQLRAGRLDDAAGARGLAGAAAAVERAA